MNLLVIIVFIFSQYLKFVRCMKPVIRQDNIKLATTPIVEQFTYVDKTKYVLELLNNNKKRCFFSRPRRFGKTMFLRTIEAIFDPNRKGEEIFKGTFISKASYNWEKYPVMFFDFSDNTLEQAFSTTLFTFKQEQKISSILEECVHQPSNGTIYDYPFELQQFREILCTVYQLYKKPVVILIDEFDHPILEKANNLIVMEYITHFLRRFFIQMKASAYLIKLAVVTGITRSSFLDIGSTGGDFSDISENPKYGTIAGVTEQELTEYFQSEIERVAVYRGVQSEDIKEEVKEWYNGYSFTALMEKVYNPKSIIEYFKHNIPKVYWAPEGRASFLWKQFLERPDEFFITNGDIYSDLRYNGNINEADAKVLMYDAGYLTIEKFDDNIKIKSYKLGVPNKEVQKAFLIDFAKVTHTERRRELDPYIKKMRNAITTTPEPDFNTFIAVADTAIQFWPFRCSFEEGYNIHLAALMYMAGLDVEPQKNSQNAIIDVFDMSSETILLFELKLDRHGLTEALQHARKSVATYLHRRKNVLIAGISLTSKKSDTVINGWRAELYASNGTLIKSYKHEESEWFEKWRSPESKLSKSSTSTTPLSKN